MEKFVPALASTLALVALGASAVAPPASATPSRFNLAELAPAGTNPSTPRSNWDLCDAPGALTDTSQGVPAGYPVPAKWRKSVGSFYWGGVSPRVTLYQPSALVACNANGPFLAPTRTAPQTYSYKVTDVAHQDVFVALVSVPISANDTGKVWEHASWRKLAPGQATVLDRTITDKQLSTLADLSETYLLARPSRVPTNGWLGYTDWVQVGAGVIYPSIPHPNGSCAGLFPGSATTVASAPGGGYWVASSFGDISPCGAANLNDYSDALLGYPPIQGTALASEDGPYVVSDPAANGYWTVSKSGEVNAYGAAHWYGQYNRPTLVSAAVAAPSGKGYWLVTADGKVLHYGNAPFFGSARVANGFVRTKQDTVGEYTLASAGITGIAPTEGDHGYVLVARDGTVYGFGHHAGASCGTVALPSGTFVSGVAPDYRTGGYWVAETDGHVVACHAPTFPAKTVTGTVMGIGALGSGLGYRLVTAGGRVYAFGAAVFRGNPD